jgi:hypothetical protein
MVEELTPQVATSSLFLIIICAPILTLILSMVLLVRYRRAVTRAMAAAGEFRASVTATPQTAGPSPYRLDDGTGHGRPGLYRLATRAPWRSALQYAVAGLAFALVFALAARFVYPLRLDVPGFLIAVWIYAWPVVVALPLIVPGPRWVWAASVLAYFVVYALFGLWAAAIADVPEYRAGGIVLPARSGATPSGMTSLWLAANSGPTILMWFCFNRRVRAVAPLVLSLVTTAITGTWIALLALFSRRGVEAAVAVAVSLGLSVYWLVAAVVVLSLASFGALGWGLARWVAGAYRRRKLSDRSLMLDALWLLFASAYTMWLVLGGLAWAATAPAAFLAYKLVLGGQQRFARRASDATRGLTFLRVFSLGRRSDVLLDSVAKYWRHIGSVQVITGPDVALSTVQPHQFLDFLSGKLSRHFVRDQASLEHSLAARDRVRDPDGRFRINNFFCHADSWQPALPRLVEEGDAVLMDLRNFSSTNAGCIHELRHLAQNVPIDQCLLIVDHTTDEPFLERTLKEAWQQLSPESPNHRRSPDEATVHRFEPGPVALRRLVRRLCEPGAG